MVPEESGVVAFPGLSGVPLDGADNGLTESGGAPLPLPGVPVSDGAVPGVDVPLGSSFLCFLCFGFLSVPDVVPLWASGAAELV